MKCLVKSHNIATLDVNGFIRVADWLIESSFRTHTPQRPSKLHIVFDSCQEGCVLEH
jgi:hypothetical protein